MSQNQGAKKVYTKGGDNGKTSLVGGTRVIKTDPRIEAYGTLDELNAIVGLVRLYTQDLIATPGSQTPELLAHLDRDFDRIQCDLFTLGSRLACEDDATLQKLAPLRKTATQEFEERMDQISMQLKPLRNFVLPGGVKAAVYLHLARTVCRRAERRVIEVADHQVVEPEVIAYLNRLSDFFFVASRYLNDLAKIAEREWRG